jgi:hypothetical protein
MKRVVKFVLVLLGVLALYVILSFVALAVTA